MGSFPHVCGFFWYKVWCNYDFVRTYITESVTSQITVLLKRVTLYIRTRRCSSTQIFGGARDFCCEAARRNCFFVILGPKTNMLNLTSWRAKQEWHRNTTWHTVYMQEMRYTQITNEKLRSVHHARPRMLVSVDSVGRERLQSKWLVIRSILRNRRRGKSCRMSISGRRIVTLDRWSHTWIVACGTRNTGSSYCGHFLRATHDTKFGYEFYMFKVTRITFKKTCSKCRGYQKNGVWPSCVNPYRDLFIDADDLPSHSDQLPRPILLLFLFKL